MTEKDLIESQLRLIGKIAEYEGSTLTNELDKLIADKPIKDGVDYFQGYVFEKYVCSKCGRPIGDEALLFNYCPNCGKRVDK